MKNNNQKNYYEIDSYKRQKHNGIYKVINETIHYGISKVIDYIASDEEKDIKSQK